MQKGIMRYNRQDHNREQSQSSISMPMSPSLLLCRQQEIQEGKPRKEKLILNQPINIVVSRFRNATTSNERIDKNDIVNVGIDTNDGKKDENLTTRTVPVMEENDNETEEDEEAAAWRILKRHIHQTRNVLEIVHITEQFFGSHLKMVKSGSGMVRRIGAANTKTSPATLRGISTTDNAYTTTTVASSRRVPQKLHQHHEHQNMKSFVQQQILTLPKLKQLSIRGPFWNIRQQQQQQQQQKFRQRQRQHHDDDNNNHHQDDTTSLNLSYFITLPTTLQILKLHSGITIYHSSNQVPVLANAIRYHPTLQEISITNICVNCQDIGNTTTATTTMTKEKKERELQKVKEGSNVAVSSKEKTVAVADAGAGDDRTSFCVLDPLLDAASTLKSNLRSFELTCIMAHRPRLHQQSLIGVPALESFLTSIGHRHSRRRRRSNKSTMKNNDDDKDDMRENVVVSPAPTPSSSSSLFFGCDCDCTFQKLSLCKLGLHDDHVQVLHDTLLSPSPSSSSSSLPNNTTTETNMTMASSLSSSSSASTVRCNNGFCALTELIWNDNRYTPQTFERCFLPIILATSFSSSSSSSTFSSPSLSIRPPPSLLDGQQGQELRPEVTHRPATSTTPNPAATAGAIPPLPMSSSLLPQLKILKIHCSQARLPKQQCQLLLHILQQQQQDDYGYKEENYQCHGKKNDNDDDDDDEYRDHHFFFYQRLQTLDVNVSYQYREPIEFILTMNKLRNHPRKTTKKKVMTKQKYIIQQHDDILLLEHLTIVQTNVSAIYTVLRENPLLCRHVEYNNIINNNNSNSFEGEQAAVAAAAAAATTLAATTTRKLSSGRLVGGAAIIRSSGFPPPPPPPPPLPPPVSMSPPMIITTTAIPNSSSSSSSHVRKQTSLVSSHRRKTTVNKKENKDNDDGDNVDNHNIHHDQNQHKGEKKEASAAVVPPPPPLPPPTCYPKNQHRLGNTTTTTSQLLPNMEDYFLNYYCNDAKKNFGNTVGDYSNNNNDNNVNKNESAVLQTPPWPTSTKRINKNNCNDTTSNDNILQNNYEMISPVGVGEELERQQQALLDLEERGVRKVHDDQNYSHPSRWNLQPSHQLQILRQKQQQQQRQGKHDVSSQAPAALADVSHVMMTMTEMTTTTMTERSDHDDNDDKNVGNNNNNRKVNDDAEAEEEGSIDLQRLGCSNQLDLDNSDDNDDDDDEDDKRYQQYQAFQRQRRRYKKLSTKQKQNRRRRLNFSGSHSSLETDFLLSSSQVNHLQSSSSSLLLSTTKTDAMTATSLAIADMDVASNNHRLHHSFNALCPPIGVLNVHVGDDHHVSNFSKANDDSGNDNGGGGVVDGSTVSAFLHSIKNMGQGGGNACNDNGDGDGDSYCSSGHDRHTSPTNLVAKADSAKISSRQSDGSLSSLSSSAPREHIMTLERCKRRTYKKKQKQHQQRRPRRRRRQYEPTSGLNNNTGDLL